MSASTPEDASRPYTPEELRTIRKRELGLSIDELAAKLGYDPSTVWRHETGKTQNVGEFIRNLEQLWDQEVDRRLKEEPRLVRGRAAKGEKVLLRLVPERPTSVAPPEIYWAPPAKPPLKEETGTKPGQAVLGGGVRQETREAPEGLQQTEAPPVDNPLENPEGPTPKRVYGREVMKLKFVISAVAIFVSVRYSRRPRAQEAAGQPRRHVRPWIVAASVALGLVFAGCLQAMEGTPWTEAQVARAPGKKMPHHASEQLPSGEDGQESEDTAPPGHSTPMPKKPFRWQKRPPCDAERSEFEEAGGCWIKLPGERPPCVGLIVKDGGCIQPVIGLPKGRYSESP